MFQAYNYTIGRVFGFIRKLVSWSIKSIQYSIVLWNDCDYDYSSIFNIIKYKIGRTRKHIHKHNIVLKSEIIVAQMKCVEDLIDKYLEDDFCEKLFEEHDRKWGTIKIVDKKMTRSKVTSESMRTQQSQEFFQIIKQAEKEKEKVRKEIFGFLCAYIEWWWD